ncbi:hypothetical protein DRE_06610 [Drechslerella stenobrocha 248]|uniref:Manganese/iron superoxide dismutase C-terminal domain-containing protein n=1 Tax=Drechslerella stenobrocha 248 TaxID=1043628 RepID=W7HKV0_9PEZI|nr:hypothetical protein DRE_06610 [Drechslerella stenobrocha 248]
MPPPRLRPTRLLCDCSNLAQSFTSAPPRVQWARPSALLKRPNRSAPLPLTHRRTLFTHKALVNEATSTAEGIPPLYSAAQFNIAWKECQTYNMDRLNILTAGTELAQKQPQDLAIMTSRNSDQAAIFNHASMMHNNHFFFQTLTATPIAPGTTLLTTINDAFGRFDVLRETMISTALACFSNAFVWLVIDNENRKPRILTTYNSGTPYGAAHRRQSVDTNTATPVPAGDSYQERLARASMVPASVDPNASSEATSSGTTYAVNLFTPLLCVNVWQHAYLFDYGFDGKERYLENWWKCVDWGVVWGRLEPLGFHHQRGPDLSSKTMFGAAANPVRDNNGISVQSNIRGHVERLRQGH